MKQILLLNFLLLSLTSYSQVEFENKTKVYSFTMPVQYENQASQQLRNEFVFVNKADTTSLVVNVNERLYSKKELQSFKEASNSDVESRYFNVLQNPKIIDRGELSTYKDHTIFFHVSHSVQTEKENDYMLTYLFYNKGKEINFIFRTKGRRLEKVLPEIIKIVNSVKLLN